MDAEKIPADDGSAPRSQSENQKIMDGVILIPQPSSNLYDPLVRILKYFRRSCILLTLNAELVFPEEGHHCSDFVPGHVLRLCGSLLRPAQSEPASRTLRKDRRRDHLFRESNNHISYLYSSSL
jgi:hypothetical protein